MADPINIAQPFNNLDIKTLQNAIDASRSPLIITDNSLPDNPIIYSNKAFEELTGYRLDEIIGKNCRFLQGSDTKKSEIKSLHTAVHTGGYVRTTLKNYRKDGTPFWNDLVVSPVADASGAVTHFIGMQLDITDRITSAERLEEHANALQAANEELEQFSYAASHDLQEPLRMISSYLQLIHRRYEADLDDDGKVFLNYATEGAERMQALINDLLSLSRISTTGEKFKPIAVDKVIKRALLNLKVSIDETDAHITIGDMPTMKVDAIQLTQLFQNLIGNALKYRQPGQQPVIEVTAEQHGDQYVFDVTDNGIGVDTKFHKRIFQVFQRLHTKNEYPGTGIGLSICSKIVDRHSGKIWVESDGKNQGCHFKFTIPIKKGITR